MERASLHAAISSRDVYFIHHKEEADLSVCLLFFSFIFIHQISE